MCYNLCLRSHSDRPRFRGELGLLLEALSFGDRVKPFAWFVDAGYLLAAGGVLCAETRKREELDVDYVGLTKAFASWGWEWAAEWGFLERLPYLRTYWYDGGADGRPTENHLEVARLAGVKLRLGRLVRGRQKGVDSLIVRDLMRLSQNQAISTAYLLGGDEDLREGMVEAQEMGVRVVLVGIEPFGEQNQAGTLIREADEVIALSRDRLVPFFRKRETAMG